MSTREGHVEFRTSRTQGSQEFKTSVWLVRERFMAVTDAGKASRLLGQFGPLRRKDPRPRFFPSAEEETLSWSAFLSWKAYLRGFMLEPTPDCFSAEGANVLTKAGLDEVLRKNTYASPLFTVEMGHLIFRSAHEPSPYINFSALDVFGAVYGSIYIDKMRGLRGHVCAREDCSNTFLSSDDRKIWCDGPGDCEATVRMRRVRADAKRKRLGAEDGKAQR